MGGVAHFGLQREGFLGSDGVLWMLLAADVGLLGRNKFSALETLRRYDSQAVLLSLSYLTLGLLEGWLLPPWVHSLAHDPCSVQELNLNQPSPLSAAPLISSYLFIRREGW